MKKTILFPVLIGVGLLFAGCSATRTHLQALMPTPEVYAMNGVSVAAGKGGKGGSPVEGILFATTRAPAEEGDRAAFYGDTRGYAIRVGVAGIVAGGEPGCDDCAEALPAVIREAGVHGHPLQVARVREFGTLDDTAGPQNAAHLFAERVNARLEHSGGNDVFVYVPGHRVVFENPVIMAGELWHFMGYEGVFIAYSWPSIHSRLAYVANVENAAQSARDLRRFIEFLATQTRARRIHVVAHSAGTRLVIQALGELTLKYFCPRDAGIGRGDELRLGTVLLIGSDLDRDRLGGYLQDGLLGLVDHLYIYLSSADKALAVSKWLHRRERLGQMWEEETPRASMKGYIADGSRLAVIDVTGAERATTGSGHVYFFRSPWVSSDVLVTLLYDLPPAARGLTRPVGSLVWQFPPDYPRRLQQALDAR